MVRRDCKGESWPTEREIDIEAYPLSVVFYPPKDVVAKSLSGATDRFFRDAFELCKFDLPGKVEVTDEGKDWTEGAGGKDGPEGSDCPDRCIHVACPSSGASTPLCSAKCGDTEVCHFDNNECGMCYDPRR